MKKKKMMLNRKLQLQKVMVSSLESQNITGGIKVTTKCDNPTLQTYCMNGSYPNPCAGPDNCFATVKECETAKIVGCGGGTPSLVTTCDITAVIATNCNCQNSLIKC